MEIPISPSLVRLVDDDASFLTAASRLLRASGFTVETFDSATDLVSQLSADSRGCVIADVRMPRVSGLDLQDALAKSGVTLPVIFLTGQGDTPSSVRAMPHGAGANRKAAAQGEQQAAQQQQAGQQTYLKARGACLEGRGYTVK